MAQALHKQTRNMSDPYENIVQGLAQDGVADQGQRVRMTKCMFELNLCPRAPPHLVT